MNLLGRWFAKGFLDCTRCGNETAAAKAAKGISPPARIPGKSAKDASPIKEDPVRMWLGCSGQYHEFPPLQSCGRQRRPNRSGPVLAAGRRPQRPFKGVGGVPPGSENSTLGRCGDTARELPVPAPERRPAPRSHAGRSAGFRCCSRLPGAPRVDRPSWPEIGPEGREAISPQLVSGRRWRPRTAADPDNAGSTLAPGCPEPMADGGARARAWFSAAESRRSPRTRSGFAGASPSRGYRGCRRVAAAAAKRRISAAMSSGASILPAAPSSLAAFGMP